MRFRLAFGKLVILLALLLCAASAFVGVIYLAGLKADIADRLGPAGKVVSVVLTVLSVPLFSLGRFMARRRGTARDDSIET